MTIVDVFLIDSGVAKTVGPHIAVVSHDIKIHFSVEVEWTFLLSYVFSIVHSIFIIHLLFEFASLSALISLYRHVE